MEERNNNPKPNGKRRFSFYWIYVILTVILFALYFSGRNEISKEEIDLGQFIEMLKGGEVSKIELVNKETADIYVGDEKEARYSYRIGSLERFEETVEKVQEENGIANPVYITNVQRKNWGLDFLFTWILPFVFIIAIWLIFMRGMGRGGLGGGGQIFNIGNRRHSCSTKTMCR